MDQTYESIIRRKVALLDEWHKSSEYKDLCEDFSCRAASLVDLGKQRLTRCADLLDSRPARTETASNSDLHRGFYCPSLVYDLVVGNVRRGKLLKRLSSKSKSYFLYAFDQDDSLIISKRFYNGCLAHTEYLFHEENQVYGITLDSNSNLQHVSAERYDHGKIVCYEHALILPTDDNYQCLHMWREDYAYDSAGLKICYFHEFYPDQRFYTKNRFTFDWREGCMAGYTSAEIIGVNDPVVLSSSYYDIKPK